MTERAIVAWCPDWPVRAATEEAALGPDTAVALVERGVVRACSASARAAGVRRGLKEREAQSRCPALVVLPANPDAEARLFEPVLAAIEAGIPTVQVARPGVVVIRASGPTRFYGGETAAADAVLGLLAAVPDARVGIADGPFAAEQAARAAGASRVRIVPAGGSAGFLAPLPVALTGLPELTAVLGKLGVRTLGDFAALDESRVRDRFGPVGAAAHLVARGLDPSRVVARIVPADRERRQEFEPPLDRVDQVAFALRRTAEDFVTALLADALVCTALEVEVTGEHGGTRRRTWLHPRSFTPLDVVDRVRWQLQGSGTEPGLDQAVAAVRLIPAAVDAAAHHEAGLWGGGPDERIHHALSRVQSMLGHDAVLTAQVGGGRLSADRRVLTPWGERREPPRPADRPWPGAVPGVAPATVFTAGAVATGAGRVDVTLTDPGGHPVEIASDRELTAAPGRFTPPGSPTVGVVAWAGPWPLAERWWDPAQARDLHRMQIACDDGSAWLVCYEHGGWWAEARYD